MYFHDVAVEDLVSSVSHCDGLRNEQAACSLAAAHPRAPRRSVSGTCGEVGQVAKIESDGADLLVGIALIGQQPVRGGAARARNRDVVPPSNSLWTYRGLI